MTHQEFLDYRRDVHAPLLLSIPETKQYVRKFVVSVPVPTSIYPAPVYDAMVEAWFDNVEDLTSFFRSDNFVNIVDPDHANFLDVSAAVRLVTEETALI